jgi:hypothetical protein
VPTVQAIPTSLWMNQSEMMAGIVMIATHVVVAVGALAFHVQEAMVLECVHCS